MEKYEAENYLLEKYESLIYEYSSLYKKSLKIDVLAELVLLELP